VSDNYNYSVFIVTVVTLW